MNKPKNDEFQDQPEFRNPSDTMLSTLLEGLFEREEAPDLRSRISASLAKATVANPRCTIEEYDEAVRAASLDIKAGYGTVFPPPISYPSVISEPALEDYGLWLRRGFYLTAALAAVVLGAIFIPDSYKSLTQPAKTHLSSPDFAINSPMPKESSQNEDRLVVATPKVPSTRIDLEPSTPEQIEPLTTRIEMVERENSVSTEVATSLPASSSLVGTMSNKEIVGVIDSQLNFLWDRLGVTTTPNSQIETWLDRAAIAILGRQATNAEKQIYFGSKSEDRIAKYVDTLIASNEFARYWSLKLAEHYLGRRLPPSRDLSGSEFAFLEWLQDSLAQKEFIGDIERKMIDGPSRTVNQSIRTDPASLWLIEVMEQSANSHRDTFDQLVPPAKRRQPLEESLIGVSRQLMRIAGNQSMVCAQCHLEESGNSDLGNYISISKQQIKSGSDSFWSVPANFSGLTIIHQTFERTLRSEPPAEYYYEDGDGRMKLASSGPPSLRKREKPNGSLGEWFRASPEPRRAIVELVWGQIFKQPLVPTIGLSENEGLNERIDLRELLANQMQGRTADLGSLVRWMVFAKTFRLEGIKTDAPWYIKSTDLQIAESQRKMRLFAGFSGSDVVGVESGKLSPSKVATWLEQKRSFQKAESAMLAQGGNEKNPTNAPKSSKIEYSDDQVRFFVSVEEPYRQWRALSHRWANSSMSWQMLLEHVYLATDARFPTKLERDEANKLFESSGRDRAKSLVVIVNGRLGSW